MQTAALTAPPGSPELSSAFRSRVRWFAPPERREAWLYNEKKKGRRNTQG